MKCLFKLFSAVFMGIRSVVEFIFGWAVLLFYIGSSIFIFFGCCKIFLEPLAPLVTIALAAWGTIYAFNRSWTTRIISLCGLALYASGWPIAHHYNPLVGEAASGLGFITWLVGVCWFALRSTHSQPVPATC